MVSAEKKIALTNIKGILKYFIRPVSVKFRES